MLRRDFLRKLGYAGGAAGLFLTGCGAAVDTNIPVPEKPATKESYQEAEKEFQNNMKGMGGAPKN